MWSARGSHHEVDHTYVDALSKYSHLRSLHLTTYDFFPVFGPSVPSEDEDHKCV